jgi:hypothetical protein
MKHFLLRQIYMYIRNKSTVLSEVVHTDEAHIATCLVAARV